jgi:predicted enzyme related to lactoylglutathione lyase
MGRVVHFEIHATDLDRAQRFYGEAFGWQVQRWEGAPVDYRLVTTGPGDRPGIDGALAERGERQGVICTIEVDDLAATERAIQQLGGERITEPGDIPGVGRHAYFRDPDGIAFGVLQPAPPPELAPPFDAGTRVVAEAESTERRARHGEILEVMRHDRPRYRIRWDDGHESVYTPSAGALHREEEPV